MPDGKKTRVLEIHFAKLFPNFVCQMRRRWLMTVVVHFRNGCIIGDAVYKTNHVHMHSCIQFLKHFSPGVFCCPNEGNNLTFNYYQKII